MMNALELLHQRQSINVLTAPGPDDEALDNILKAAMRVPDHAGLTPWQITVLTGKGQERLSRIMVQAAKSGGADPAKLEKVAKKPFRAPTIIIVSTRFKEHPKVPVQEQIIAAGCTVHAMQMAAFAQGYGAIWRTGEVCYNNDIKAGLDIDSQEEIVGFLYLGTATGDTQVKPVRDYREYVRYMSN